MRVALFSGNYNNVVDGPARALNRLVAHLETRGCDTLVFAPTIKSPAFAHNGTLISTPSVALPGSRREYRLTLGLPAKARARLDAFKPSIIHLSAPDPLGVGAIRYASTRNIPVVASFHTRFDKYPRYYNAQWAEKYVLHYLRWFYSRCAQVYPPTQSMADELKAAGIGRDLRLWARGVDAALFSPFKRDFAWRRKSGFAADDVVVLFVGRVVLEKGVDMFAQGWRLAKAANPKLRALIVGEGPARAHFEALLPEGVFCGHLEGDALARAYASADIFFNPSITETFGQVTLEAMASGLPCVCAAAPGSVSLVTDSATGFISRPEEGAGGFASRIGALAADWPLRKRLGLAGRNRALQCDWPAILDGLIDNYREAIEARAGAELAQSARSAA
jgi:glycosyltransferase involved in cell wall biosynthesis